jgi:hypothetical protein
MSSPEAQSFSVFSATVVIAACDAWMQSLKNEINDNMEDFVTELMSRKRSLLDPFFKPPKTRDEAIQRIKDDPDHLCHWIPMFSSGNSIRVKSLRTLAIAAQAQSSLAPVNVSAQDAEILGEFLVRPPSKQTKTVDL